MASFGDRRSGRPALYGISGGARVLPEMARCGPPAWLRPGPGVHSRIPAVSDQGAIDIHAHFFPEPFLDAIADGRGAWGARTHDPAASAARLLGLA